MRSYSYYRRIDDSQICKLKSEENIDILYRYIIFKPHINLDMVDLEKIKAIDMLVCSTDNPLKAIEASQQAPTELLFDIGLYYSWA